MNENNAKVMKVNHVKLQFGFSKPPTLIIVAEGSVPTLGWSNGQLIPHVYIDPPADGVWDMDFVAEHPSGIVPQVISKIHSKPFIATAPPWFKGVRIHSSTNSLETSGGENDAEQPIKLVHFDTQATGGHDTLPWAANASGGVDVLPWAAKVSGGVDGFPWATNISGGVVVLPWTVRTTEKSSDEDS